MCVCVCVRVCCPTGLLCVRAAGGRLGVGADALLVDGVVGVTQQHVGEARLQQVHGEEGRLLHDLEHKAPRQGAAASGLSAEERQQQQQRHRPLYYSQAALERLHGKPAGLTPELTLTPTITLTLTNTNP